MLQTPSEASGAIVPRAVGAPLPTPRNIFSWLTNAAVTIPLWTERVRQRRALAELDDHLLRDIGLTRVEAWQEIKKPFWRR